LDEKPNGKRYLAEQGVRMRVTFNRESGEQVVM
jgi:hypothetical protein